MKITKEEYVEYEKLKEWAKKQKVYQSANAITKLEDDIDLPIRKCVAMVALLGCEPTFSCCGFDYDGQPFHKSHQYREPYIRMKSNAMSTKLYINTNLRLAKHDWSFRTFVDEIILELVMQMNPHWKDSNCIHMSEECVIGIDYLEKTLASLYQEFMPTATIYDTNESHQHRFRFWQYPPKKSWTIYRSKLADY